MMQFAGFRGSMSRRADCYDNAPMESFFHTLKHAHPFMTNLTKARRVAPIAPCAALNLKSASN